MCIKSVLSERIGLEHYKNSERGIRTPISIVFGADPELTLASQAKVGFDDEKYYFARTISNRPLHLVKSETSNILVPLHCELVIEGLTVVNSRYDDSKFGEYSSCYSMKSNAFIVEVTKITHKKDYIMPIYVTGRAPNEDIHLCGPAVAAHTYLDLEKLGSEITNISCYKGNSVFTSIVAIKKKTNMEVKNILHRMVSNNYIKNAIVVDHDLDPESDNDFWFAFDTRFRPESSIQTTPYLMTGASLDPCYNINNACNKSMLDLTIPIGKTKEETEEDWSKHRRVDIPGEDDVTWDRCSV